MGIPDGEFQLKKKGLRDKVKVSVAEKENSASKGAFFIREAVLNAPDIRIGKVDAVRAEIAEGRFQIDSEAVAGKIIQDIIIHSRFHK